MDIDRCKTTWMSVYTWLKGFCLLQGRCDHLVCESWWTKWYTAMELGSFFCQMNDECGFYLWAGFDLVLATSCKHPNGLTTKPIWNATESQTNTNLPAEIALYTMRNYDIRCSLGNWLWQWLPGNAVVAKTKCILWKPTAESSSCVLIGGSLTKMVRIVWGKLLLGGQKLHTHTLATSSQTQWHIQQQMSPSIFWVQTKKLYE